MLSVFFNINLPISSKVFSCPSVSRWASWSTSPLLVAHVHIFVKLLSCFFVFIFIFSVCSVFLIRFPPRSFTFYEFSVPYWRSRELSCPLHVYSDAGLCSLSSFLPLSPISLPLAFSTADLLSLEHTQVQGAYI